MKKNLKNGEVFFEPIYQRIEESSETEPSREEMEDLIQQTIDKCF
jgi:hypothetical protein